MELIAGDCIEVMRGMADASVDAVVTDPPAGIHFMAKSWDHHKGGRDQWITWMAGVARECLRIAKPGSHALVWAIPRTSHWTATAWENGGWEPRDRIAHLYGQGFPKSLNLGNGIGTALKPACEDWWLFRKPLAGTVVANVLRFGTGGLNIDGCRIATDESTVRRNNPSGDAEWYRLSVRATLIGSDTGRWPANIVLSCACDGAHDRDCAVALVDAASGATGGFAPASGPTLTGESESVARGLFAGVEATPFYGDSGGASRFFYTAKASRAEREFGLDDLPGHTPGELTDRKDGAAGTAHPRAGAGRAQEWGSIQDGRNKDGRPYDRPYRRNTHPTVKPVDLMRWLCRLVTPPGGVVLDPFCGSGSTGMAALDEGFEFIGIDQDEHYLEIARRRIASRHLLETAVRPPTPDRVQGALL